MVNDKPSIRDSVCWCSETKKLGSIVEKRRTKTGPSQTEIIDIKIPINARWCILPTEHLKCVPTCKNLSTENLIIFDFQIINIESGLCCVRRKHGPPEDWNTTERYSVPSALYKLLMLYRWLARKRVNHWHAERARKRDLLIRKRQFTRTKLPRWYAHTTCREPAPLGNETTPINLAKDVCSQANKASVTINRSENGSACNNTTGSRDIIKHAHCFDHTLPLPKNDIAFHIQFQRRICCL